MLVGPDVKFHHAKASFDTRPCELPPDFRAGYRPPWLAQQDEDQRRRAAM